MEMYKGLRGDSREQTRNICFKFTQNSTVRAFVSGSTSGVISTVLLQPLDVIKTRLQNPPVDLIKGRNGQLQIISIVCKIIKDDSIKGLWKGTTPALFRTVPGIGIYFSLLEHIKSHFFKNKVLSPTESLLIGGIARSLAGATLMPLTVVKTRFESGVYSYTGVLPALRQISHYEGIRGLTKGLLPTVCRDAPYAGLYFMFYNQTKNMIPKDIYSNHPTAVYFFCAIISSTLASFATQPPDVFKTQLQINPDKFTGIWAVIVHIYVRHGLCGYFQGILPRLLRRTGVACISWTLYEKTKQNKQKY